MAGEPPPAAEFEVHIHPAWWSPRVFPFVVVILVLAAYAGFLTANSRYYQPVAFLCLTIGIVVVLLKVQLRKCRIVLAGDRIVFPEWRRDDASEIGVSFDPRYHAERLNPERITTLAASEIADWLPDRGRIVIWTKSRKRHGIGVLGLRPGDRERITAWLVERVGG